MIARNSPTEPAIRLAEVVTALSLATDIGMGQPLSFALRSCMLSLRIGRAAGMSEPALSTIYFEALLRYIGCNVDTHTLAAIVGDEISMRRNFAAIDSGKASEIVGVVLGTIRDANDGASALQLAQAMARGLLALPGMKAGFAGHCEVAQRLAARLGLGADVQTALGQLYERWDGKGAPQGLRGEAIAPAVRVVTLAQDALVHYRLGGAAHAVEIVRSRRGSAYDPQLADCFCSDAVAMLADMDQEPALETVPALEPGTPRWLDQRQFDEACRALGDFVDIKSLYTLGHSEGVAQLCAAAAEAAGLGAPEVDAIRRAGWVHDIGRAGVTSAIWEKPGPLSAQEWDKVRLHTYFTQNVLACSPGLAKLGELAGLHHERCDGSGYHLGRTAAQLPMAARILAAADAYQALIEERPYRPAFDAAAAAAELQAAARAGQLDPGAVGHVLRAAGHRVRRGKPGTAAGLSEREVQVLRLMARGDPTKRIAQKLGISAKTADHHIQNIYGKIGVATRAGATLFAMEHGLLELDGGRA
jgi:HD-GYP domain-containing protein (c-di-GMP phosphodiesterase class II)